MKNKSGFDILCDEIEKSEQAEMNYIDIARKKVDEKSNGDSDTRLQLLAEAKAEDYITHISLLISMFSLTISALTLIITIVQDYYQYASPYGALGRSIMIVIIILKIVISVGTGLFALRLSHFMKKYKNVNKWRKYVLMVLEQETK